jgi:hypothetical protein
MGLTSGICGLAMIVVALRMYTRTFMSRFRGPDDWFILAAAVRMSRYDRGAGYRSDVSFQIFSMVDQGLKIACELNVQMLKS